jgi:hypothetical protein
MLQANGQNFLEIIKMGILPAPFLARKVQMAFRILFAILAFALAATLSACGSLRSKQIDNNLNPWLGKTKDERIRRIGPP